MKLFLDDLREATVVYPEDSGWIIVRDFEQFKQWIAENGIPETVSFDNDLGIDTDGNTLPEGYDALKWLIDNDMVVKHIMVHSDNITASENIAVYAYNWHKHLIREGILLESECSVTRRSALHRKWFK